ncbi:MULTISPECIES: aspartate kinase [Eubacterium]|uniref:Aspartokinase n=1 Tax=Eubacterium ruminantium TaxID=42322 RepID=A0A1T4QLB4_9FIRM|nr:MULTISPECIES: aspartate kinase [Eubacterium]MCR5367515.1 aspartate kinase [Eubacterium sp.]SCW68609.1 aspartate kinase [Eubacterium ruminantium]SDN41323.1 aspartate kinase [Eubacterium ruminantium]SKA04573.1 aspartate kinase [Eubacterium ruminantium]
MLVVKKFGGTSVANKERIYNVANRCIEEYKKGNDVVVVLSAMGKYTDELIDMAKDINENPPKREMDMLYTIGEQMSVALMAMAMNKLGVPAISLNAFQVAMHTTSVYGNARLKRIDVDRVKNELEQRKIVIITGFQGVNKYDDYTTLGRGGSDTTAVALAAALHADKCEIYTDVDGVYTADPRKVKTARKLDTVTYDEMLELATLGAGVLHNRSVELAKKFGVQLVVRSSLNNNEGTVVKEDTKMEKMIVSGVAADPDAARVAVVGLKDEPGVAFKLFNALAKKNINVDMILQSVGRHGTKDISFTCSDEDADEAEKIIGEIMQFESIDVNKDVAKVSIVGAGMQTNAGVAAKMFEALYDENINIRMISTSEIRVTVLIDVKNVERAMNAVHDKFELGE